MKLLVVYSLFIIVGEALAVGLGELVELSYPSASLFTFLGLFTFVLWAGWVLALRVTREAPAAT